MYNHLQMWWSTRNLLVISRASARICLNGLVMGAFVLPRSWESANFGSVFLIGSAHRSSSLLEVLECSQLALADQVRLATCGRVGRAISSGRFFRLRSRPLLDWSPLVGTSCCTYACFQFWNLLSWSSMLTHLESFCTRLRLVCQWRPNFFLVQVHIGLGTGWLCCHSVVGWELLWFPRFYNTARCRVKLCRSLRPSSSKTIRCSG